MFLETSDPPIFCAHNLSSAPLTFSEKRKLSLAVRVDSRAIGSGIYAISAATGTLGTEALHPIGHVFLARARFSIPLSLRVCVCVAACVCVGKWIWQRLLGSVTSCGHQFCTNSVQVRGKGQSASKRVDYDRKTWSCISFKTTRRMKGRLRSPPFAVLLSFVLIPVPDPWCLSQSSL